MPTYGDPLTPTLSPTGEREIRGAASPSSPSPLPLAGGAGGGRTGRGQRFARARAMSPERAMKPYMLRIWYLTARTT